MKKQLFLLFFITLVTPIFAQNQQNKAEVWADSLYQTLTIDEKIGQLFMIPAYSNKNEKHVAEIEQLIKKNHVGGVIFFQGTPTEQAKITNRLQEQSQIPLFIGIDAEWGLAMRLDDTYSYPWNMSLGAIQDLKLIEEMGKQMGEQAKRIGVHFMFAPVVDINTNPDNPIIGNRSFGENKKNVAQKAVALVKGMQAAGVYATAKHFPGHGDTSKDSHHALPTINFDRNRIENIELYPYKELIKNDLASIMVAHLEVPAIEPESGRPTSLSYKTVTELLKNQLNFKGLIFTDALNMKGASNAKAPGEIDLVAFEAGNDVLLFSGNVDLGVKKIKSALEEGRISEARLKESVTKILRYKYLLNLNQTPHIDLANLDNDLHQPKFDDLSFELYEKMITLLQNKQHIIPLKSFENIAYIPLDYDGDDIFLEKLQRYGSDITKLSVDEVNKNFDELGYYDKIIIGNHKPDNIWKKNEFTNSEVRFIEKIAEKYPTILISFAKPYTLEKLKNPNKIKGLILAYQNNTFAFDAVANALYGFSSFQGKIPVSVGNYFKEGDGLQLKQSKNISVSTPELEHMDADILKKIEGYGNRIFREDLAPGAVVLVLKNGKIVYNKAFGNYTYSHNKKVTPTTIYDLASLSKMLGTLPLVMKLYEDKKIKFEDKLGDLLPEFKYTNKANITVKELLTHQSGLVAWIPFYKHTLDEEQHPSTSFYNFAYSKNFPIQVSENLFIKNGYKKTIINEIIESPTQAKKYKYSDLNFILLQQIVERIYHKPLNELFEQYFAKPMQLESLTYNPLQKFDLSEIAPTEIDNYFRYTNLQGYVHDMGAAMLGGIAGHAGLFSNAYDVAAMMQMFLDGGSFNGKQLLSPKTIQAFNTCYYCNSGNRRGAGFDKPNLETAGNTCGCTSPQSFGHTGFTGTMAWADPTKQLVYVFLSNRTYPHAETNRLSKANIREDIQQVIYDALTD